jgi:hypothetical protein
MPCGVCERRDLPKNPVWYAGCGQNLEEVFATFVEDIGGVVAVMGVMLSGYWGSGSGNFGVAWGV